MKNNHIIAKAIRVEYDEESNDIYLVFQVIDEAFRQEIKKDWLQDIEVKLLGKNLIKEDI